MPSQFLPSAFSLTTAMQFLRVERRRLTIVLMYGIITAEKELMWSWIFDFLIAFISHRNGLDHSFDHLQLRTTWKQCPQEHPKAPFSDTKAPKSLINQEKICADLFGTSMPQVRILSLRPKFVLYALKNQSFS